MTEQARKEFEAQALVLAVKHFGDQADDVFLKLVLDRRTDGRYRVKWVDGAWLGYQAGREALERVNAELREQVEGLRKNAERFQYWRRCWANEEGVNLPLSVDAEMDADADLEVDEAFDEAMSKREQS